MDGKRKQGKRGATTYQDLLGGGADYGVGVRERKRIVIQVGIVA